MLLIVAAVAARLGGVGEVDGYFCVFVGCGGDTIDVTDTSPFAFVTAFLVLIFLCYRLDEPRYYCRPLV